MLGFKYIRLPPSDFRRKSGNRQSQAQAYQVARKDSPRPVSNRFPTKT